MLSLSAEPFRNFEVSLSGSYKTLRSASPTFSLDYNDPSSPTGISSKIEQFETIFSASYYPGRKVSGNGVERITNTDKLRSLFLQITRGSKGILNGDFDYTKVQFSYTQPWNVGGFGRLRTSLEAGKTFGEVPLGLLKCGSWKPDFLCIFQHL